MDDIITPVLGGWQPPWRDHLAAVAAVLLVRTATNFILLTELPTDADPQAFRDWLIAWLERWLQVSPAAELRAPSTFFYILLEQALVVAAGSVREIGYGAAPAAPEDWQEVRKWRPKSSFASPWLS